jgi:hypothetical protein
VGQLKETLAPKEDKGEEIEWRLGEALLNVQMDTGTEDVQVGTDVQVVTDVQVGTDDVQVGTDAGQDEEGPQLSMTKKAGKLLRSAGQDEEEPQ